MLSLLNNPLLLLTLATLVCAEYFALPTFVSKRQLYRNSLLDLRGGADNDNNPRSNDEGEETIEEYSDEWAEEEEELGIVLTDGPEVDEELETETVEEVIVDEVFDDDEEEEEEEDEIFDEEKEADNEVVFEETEEESISAMTDDENNISTFVDRMEARIATTTDDEGNSSAFVDRMELADAYDEVDTSVDQEETSLAAVSAIGGGGSEVEQAEETTSEEPVAAVSEITDEMKKILVKTLKYKSGEVKVLKPDVAATLIEKSLQRPPEGIPPNWYVEGATPVASTGLHKNALKLGVAVLTIGGVAVLGLKGDLNVGGTIGAIPAAMKSILPAKSTKSPAITSTIAVVDEPPAEPPVEVAEEEDDHPHSVKPFSAEVPHYEDDLDKSWLDKIITRCENAFKAFFRIKI